MKSKAAFLDLNGTLVMPVQVERLSEHIVLPGAITAVRLLNEHGYLCPLTTVQSRIAKGYYTEAEFTDWFATLQSTFRAEGAKLLGPFVCPHSSRENCGCHKPEIGLYQQAMAKFDIDLDCSVVVGDTGGDIEAARRLGCSGYLVRTGWGESSLAEFGVQLPSDYIAVDLLDAARRITKTTASD